MLNDMPETYSDLVRKHGVYNLANYYYLTQEQLEKIYKFLCSSATNHIRGNNYAVFMEDVNNQIIDAIRSTVKYAGSGNYQGLTLDNTGLHVDIYYPSSSSGGYSSGGSSGNNNNNNNNNNN